MNESEHAPGEPRYRRVVLKLSGESFAHAGERGISMEEVVDIARQIHQTAQMGCEIAVVIGGGNILRVRTSPTRTPASTKRPPITWACWPR